ncbi:MAG: InlB B-repeat-containing protein, partial [Defluviitaleaceae bacterium]|nr:InlB B-repeat-containing protein [Defluviitaleaceae bacterium]
NSAAQTARVTVGRSLAGTYDEITLNGTTVTFGNAPGNLTHTERIISNSTTTNPTFSVAIRPALGVSPGNSTFSAQTSFVRVGGDWKRQEDTANVSIGHIRHNVTFNLNGGNVNGSTVNITQPFNQGEIIGTENVPVPTRTNHIFLGWRQTSPTAETINLSREEVGARTANNAITFTAQWATIPHNVTFNLNGGSVSGFTSNIVRTINQGSSVGSASVPVPTHQNFTFLGWQQTAPTADDTILSNSTISTRTVTNAVTYTAQWQRITHNFTFNLNGGNVDGSAANIVRTGNQGGELGIDNAPVPVRDGFIFDGWRYPGLFIGSPNITNTQVEAHIITEPIIFTAQWLRIGAVSTGGAGNVTSADVVWLARSVANHAGFALTDNRIGNLRGDDRDPTANDITMLLRWLVGYKLEDLIS